MPEILFASSLARPAFRLRPLALIAVSALGAASLLPTTRGPAAPASSVDPIARWLDDGPRDQRAAPSVLPAILTAAPTSTPAFDDPGIDSVTERPVEAEPAAARPVAPASAGAAGTAGTLMAVAEDCTAAPDAPLATPSDAIVAEGPAEAATPASADAAGPDGVPTTAGPADGAIVARSSMADLSDVTLAAVTAGPISAVAATDTPAPAATENAAPARETPVVTAQRTAKVEEAPAHAVPSRWREHTVRKGETLGQVLKVFGIDKQDRSKVLAATKQAQKLTKLKAGQKIRGRIDDDGGLLELRLKLDPKTSVHVELSDDDYRIHEIDRPVQKRLAQTSAVIQSSLFTDGQDAGLSDAQIMELAAIFGWDVDFALGLHPGDRVSVIYEAEYLDGQQVDNGAIVAAEFVNQGRSFRALRFEDDDGTLGYYAPDGTSKKQEFLRSPLKLARVSSGFSLSRLHPILNSRRAHKGVDYSAPTGTPVKATGTGLISFRGQKSGYGNVIELQHGERYSTLYGHLSRFAEGLQVGAPVKQGQVIGYVGQTGLATGPHLHYEFRVAGEHRDPLSSKLPTAVPLEGQDLAAFKKKAVPLLTQLDRMDRTLLARAP